MLLAWPKMTEGVTVPIFLSQIIKYLLKSKL